MNNIFFFYVIKMLLLYELKCLYLFGKFEEFVCEFNRMLCIIVINSWGLFQIHNDMNFFFLNTKYLKYVLYIYFFYILKTLLVYCGYCVKIKKYFK